MAPLGKYLIVIGAVIAMLGLALWVGARLPGLSRLGRLPGDIYIQRGNFSFYFPLTTAIIVSIVLSLIIAWLRR